MSEEQKCAEGKLKVNFPCTREVVTHAHRHLNQWVTAAQRVPWAEASFRHQKSTLAFQKDIYFH